MEFDKDTLVDSNRPRLYLFDCAISEDDLKFIKLECNQKTLLFSLPLFVNRSFTEILDQRRDYQNIALNLKAKDEFEWYRLHRLDLDEQVIVIVVTSGSRRQQWVKDVTPNIICKHRDLKDLSIKINGATIINALTSIAKPETFFSKLLLFLKSKFCGSK